MKKFISVLVALLGCVTLLAAKSEKDLVKVLLEPDHSDWTYKVGENAIVRIHATLKGNPCEDFEFECSYGPDKLKAVYEQTVSPDSCGYYRLEVPGAEVPGFITVRAKVSYQGKDYKGMVNLAFDPQDIKPTVTLPDDFREYWDNAKAEAAKVPMETEIRHIAKESNSKVDVYYVKIQAVNPGTYVYGVLTVPKKEGRKPAILRLPGAAIRSFHGPCNLAYEGFVCLEIGVHGIPIDQDESYYTKLSKGRLSGYVGMGLEDRDTYYYRRVYLSLIRAIDYLCSRDDVDSSRIASYGGSQGGMLSIVAAALDSRISALFAYFPAFSDVTGYYCGRGGGWPHLFTNPNTPDIEKKLNTVRYYDTVNFARFVNTPGIYAFGYNDITCCPTSTYSAYNVIPGPKSLHIAKDTGHWLYPWQSETAMKWLKQQFNME